MKSILLTLTLLTVLLTACTQNKNILIQEGDMIFQDLNSSELADAIEAVTQKEGSMNFSHCGIAVLIGDSLKIIEAVGKEVQINSIETYLSRNGDIPKDTLLQREEGGAKVVIPSIMKKTETYRLKRKYRKAIPEAVEYAKSVLGVPYDLPYLLDNDMLYCTELFYECFKSYDIFTPLPMTFIDPKTGETLQAWIDHYEELDMEVPEGALGLTPVNVSRSDKMFKLR